MHSHRTLAALVVLCAGCTTSDAPERPAPAAENRPPATAEVPAAAPAPAPPANTQSAVDTPPPQPQAQPQAQPRPRPRTQRASGGPATTFDATWARLQAAVRARDTAAVRAFFASARTGDDRSAGSAVSTVLGDRVRAALLATSTADVREESDGVRVFVVVDRVTGGEGKGSANLFGLRFAPGASGLWRVISVFTAG